MSSLYKLIKAFTTNGKFKALNLPKSDCIYHFPIDFEPRKIVFGFKSI